MAELIVLAHSPLIGPLTWESVADELAARGLRARVPDLRDTVAGGPPYAQRQAESIAAAAAGGQAVLVGHSGAGPLLTAAGSMLDQVAGYVFVDAGLPTPGKSWLQTVPPGLAAQIRGLAGPDGWLPPWPAWWDDDELAELIIDAPLRQRFADDCPPLPLAMFSEPLPAAGLPRAPAAYLRLSEAYDGPAGQARAAGWPVTELASHHLAPVTDPALVAGSLQVLIRRLG